MKLLNLGLACALVLASVDADAKRMGGGSSIGRQSGNVTQRQATPPAPNNAGNAAQTPAQTPAQAQAARPAAAGAAAAAPKRPWGAMLGGLAAGLGLAWLANSLGFGAELAQFLMFGLLAMVIMLVIGFVMRSRRAARAAAGQDGRPFAFQGAGPAADRASAPPQYNADKVGNDASARPWERSGGMAFEGSRGASGVQIGSALAGGGTAPSTWSIPAGFDTEAFLAGAKRNFVGLQDAWDRADIPALRAMMTDEMLAEIRAQLAERESHTGGQTNKTEVVMLDAEVLGLEDIGSDYMASVEFSGMIREEPSSGPTPFREVWNMTKPKSGSSGWLVAGVQALQ
jgi:predicted lipid-binding transport protein (Tim44 family)